MGKANRYFIQMEFEGGCRNCPFCPQTSCLATGKRIEFRFKVDPDCGEVVIFFDPHQQRDVDCPLTPIKSIKEPRATRSPKTKKGGKKNGKQD